MFSLALYDIPDFKKKARRFAIEEQQIMKEYELEVANKKVEALRNKEVKALLFDKYLRMINNSDVHSIMDFF